MIRDLPITDTFMYSTYLSELRRAGYVDERGGGLYAVVLDLVQGEALHA